MSIIERWKASSQYFKKNFWFIGIIIFVIILTIFATKAWGIGNTSRFDTAKEVQKQTYIQPDETRFRRPPSTTSPTSSTTTTTKPYIPTRVSTTNATKPAQPQVTVPPSGDLWERLRRCESHGNYATNTGNGYYGAYQFSAPTWRSMNTGYDLPHLAPPEVQDDAARRLQARSGWGQWPVCARGFPAP